MATIRIDTLEGHDGNGLNAIIKEAESIIGSLMPGVTVEPEQGTTKIYGHTVSDLQSDVVVSDDGKITGTLHYTEEGALPDYWGAGYFIALKISDVPETATSILVGLDPSEGSGLVDIYGDKDMNLAAKVTNQNIQIFKTITSDGTRARVQNYDLSGIKFEPIGE